MEGRISGGLGRDEGQGLVEYALIIALVALPAAVALTLPGGGITTIFNNIMAAL